MHIVRTHIYFGPSPLPNLFAGGGGGVIPATAAATAASLILQPNVEGVFGAGLAGIMVWIAAVDARRFRIPNTAVLMAAILGLLHAGFGELGSAMNTALALGRGVVLALMFTALRSGYKLLRGRHGL